MGQQPTKRKLIYLLASLLVLSGAAVAVVVRHRTQGPALPKELSVESLQAKADENPRQVFEAVHQAMDRTDLSDAQRHALWENAHTVMEAQMDKRIDAYLNAAANQKQAILDRHLDEMQVHMKEWAARRAERDRERQRDGGSAGSRSGGPPPGGPSAAANSTGRSTDGPRRGPHQHTPQERKIRSESRDPDKMARRMAYFSAMRQRAEQRGIEMPFGRGPGH